MSKKILELLKAGKSQEEILLIISSEYPDAKKLDIMADYVAAVKTLATVKELAEGEEAAAEDAAVEAKVEAAVEKKLKTIDMKNVLDQMADAGYVKVEENANEWKKDCADFIRAKIALKKGENPSEAIATLSRVTAKSAKVMEAKGIKAPGSAVRGDSDTIGGYFMRPEFDMEVDKLNYENSPLVASMQIRTGGEKTEINSISTFDLTLRTNQLTDFTETIPAFAQEELLYREAGALIPISNAAINGSAYNLVGELTENISDADIRFIEPAVIHGTTAAYGFNGIYMKSGVVQVPGVNTGTGGTGKICSKDLTTAYLAAAAQTRGKGSFYMDSKELMVLMSELVGSDQKAVQVINGQFIHMATGRPIIAVDTLTRTLTASALTGGSYVAVVFGVMPRFRFYRDGGGIKIATSSEIYFGADCVGLRAISRFKFGIPTKSLTSFVSITKIKENAPAF